MDNHEEEPLSRSAYRKQQELAEQELEERDRKRLAVERAYAKEQKQAEYAEQGRLNQNEKSRILNKKLNRAILIVVLLELIVLAVLFFF